MEPLPLDFLPQVRILAVRVKITSQHIVRQALQALKISEHETMTHDYLSDEIIATISFDMPPHGDYLFPKKEIFYGEPSKSRDEAVELAYDSALRYLQKADIVFIDDANLNELTECKRALLRATSWAEAFEAKCVSQKALLSNMARHIRLLSSEAPLSPPDQQTPLHSTVVSENLGTDLAKGSHVETSGNTSSRQEELPSTSARRSLFRDREGYVHGFRSRSCLPTSALLLLLVLSLRNLAMLLHFVCNHLVHLPMLESFFCYFCFL